MPRDPIHTLECGERPRVALGERYGTSRGGRLPARMAADILSVIIRLFCGPGGFARVRFPRIAHDLPPRALAGGIRLRVVVRHRPRRSIAFAYRVAPGPRRMCAPSSRCEYLPDATSQPMRARQSAAWAITVWRNGGCVRRAGRRPRVERSEQGKGGAGRDEAPAAPGERLEPIVPRPSSRAPSIRLVVFPVLVPRLGRPARR